jgi:DcaP outer membrane protein
MTTSIVPAKAVRLQTARRRGRAIWTLMLLFSLGALSSVSAQEVANGATAYSDSAADAQTQTPSRSTFEIYGFAMLDIGHDFKQIHPDWFDTMRVTKLPSFEDEFGEDNRTFAGVRQSRLGVRSSTPTDLGDLKTTFEFELFGTGVDAGQTTFRLRHAYGELGAFGAGQTWSPFMDPDVFPNSLEYWGPTGMVFFRNVQVRWMPMVGDKSLILALERPGASGDAGVYADRIELQNIKPRFPLPDFSGAFKLTQPWGYVRAAGMLRRINWDDTLADRFDLSGDATGWGLNLSSNLKASSKDTLRLQVVFGEGIQNYMNDSPVDVGIENDFGNPVTPIRGEPLPIVGIVAFLDHAWNERFSSSFGYSRQDIDNTSAQAPNAFKVGQYALGNLLYTPVPNAMVGGEFQWGRRENFSDGFHSDGFKLQVSFRYNFSVRLGG